MASIREFFLKVNQDASFRKKFINSPTEALEEWGIHMSEETEEQIEEMVPIIKDHLPKLASLPTGYEALFADLRHKKHGKSDDPEMLIL